MRELVVSGLLPDGLLVGGRPSILSVPFFVILRRPFFFSA